MGPMKQKCMLVAVSLLLLVATTGCWSSRELNELAIEVALGIDKSGKRYRITSQVVDPDEVAARKGASDRTPVTTYQVTADTPLEAIRKMTTISSRVMYAAHIRMVVIGEDLARQGISEFLDYLMRNHEHRTDFYIVIAKGTTAENVLKILTPFEKIPANNLFYSLRTSEKNWAPTTSVTLDVLTSDLVSEGKHPVLTGLIVKGSQEAGNSKANIERIAPPAQLQYSGIGVFKKDKLVGWLNQSESKGFNYIMNKVKSTVGHIRCPDGGKIVMEIIRSKGNMKGKVKNGKPEIEIKIRTEANIGEVECKKLDLTKVETVYELEAISEERMRELVGQALRAAQKKYKADIFGFGEAIRRADPKAWKKMKKNWDREFVNLPVKVKADVRIRRTGTVAQSFLKELKE